MWLPAAAVLPVDPNAKDDVPAPIAERASAAFAAVNTERPVAVESVISVDATDEIPASGTAQAPSPRRNVEPDAVPDADKSPTGCVCAAAAAPMDAGV